MARGKTTDSGSGKWKYVNSTGLNIHFTKAKMRSGKDTWKPGDATPF